MIGRRITDWWEAEGIRPLGQPISRHHGCMHGMIKQTPDVKGHQKGKHGRFGSAIENICQRCNLGTLGASRSVQNVQLLV